MEINQEYHNFIKFKYGNYLLFKGPKHVKPLLVCQRT